VNRNDLHKFWPPHVIIRAIYYVSVSPAMYQKVYCENDTRTDFRIALDAANGFRFKFMFIPKLIVCYLGTKYFRLMILRDPFIGMWRIVREEYGIFAPMFFPLALYFLWREYGNRKAL